MEPFYDSNVEDEGPIIQEIPDALMVGDYIEIHGICRGPEIIVQLLSRKDPNVLPLHVRLAAGGPVLVKSQSREKIDRQEHNVRMGLQPNMDFELCIYATEGGYEVKLNKQSVCVQKHLVKLEDVSAISMDGDADFTSVEFKDIYGDEEEEEQYARAAPGPGMMVVQEMRESFSRHRGSPVLVRSSIRKSQRSEHGSNAVLQQEISRPDYDVDQANQAKVAAVAPIPVEMRKSIDTPSPKSKSRFSWKPNNRKSLSMEDDKILNSPHSSQRIFAGETHAGTFRTIDDTYANPRTSASLATLNASSGSLSDPKKKKRSSLFGKLRRSKGSEPDVSIDGSGKPKRKGLKNPFKSKKSITLAPIGSPRQSQSMPDVTTRESAIYNRISAISGPQTTRYWAAAADHAPVRGPVPKAVLKEPAPEIAAYLAAQKAVPEFEEFILTDRTSHEEQMRALETAPIATRAPSYVGPTPDRKLKGPAPELADILLDTNRANFDQTTTLTGSQLGLGSAAISRESVYSAPYPTTAPPKNLKGPAPEVAAVLDNEQFPKDTVMVSELSTKRPMSVSAHTAAIIAAPVSKAPPTKLKGPAPEVASELYDRHRGTLSLLPDTTMTDAYVQPKHEVRHEPISIASSYQSQPVYATRPVSVSRNPATRRDSDSSVQSDSEYYLEVGKSSYFFERVRSLKNYRSRRSRKADRYGSESGEESITSSISSLKADDRIIYPRKDLGNDKSWMNGYSRESDLYQPTPSRPKVYAAAPPATEPSTDPVELTLDKEELRQSNNSIKIPLALKPGRSAVVCGHFSNSSDSEKLCSIVLKSCENGETGGLLLEFGPTGSLSLIEIQKDRHKLRAKYDTGESKQNNANNQQFTIRLHAREKYMGVTLNNDVTVIVRGDIDPSILERIELLPDSSAELDYFAVANEMTIPISLKFPPTVNQEQALILQMRSDADSEVVLMEFETEEEEKFELVLQMADGCIYAKGCLGETIREIIPFVPEQIRQLTISKHITNDFLTIDANQTEIFREPLPINQPRRKLNKVRLSGDMSLLGTQFE